MHPLPDKLELPSRHTLGVEAMQMLDTAAHCSVAGPGVTRLPFTPEHQAVNTHISSWMEAAGLSVSLDEAGTLTGSRTPYPNAPTLLTGSHQDSVVNGGRYDGMLGIVVPIVAMKYLQQVELPFAVDVLAFADEEGVRFPTALLGSRSLAGTLNSADLALTDSKGISLASALDDFGGSAGQLDIVRRQTDNTIGFLEVHIEQGPVLENNNLPVGVVSGICGIERWQARTRGAAAHAGTTPMDLRHDALTAAAEIILMLERHCKNTAGLVGVVGKIENSPNAVNVIPEEVSFTVELRAAVDQVRARSSQAIEGEIRALCKQRHIDLHIDKTYAQSGVLCDARLSKALRNTLLTCGLTPLELMSGATHDASAMADLCPVSMLFVRCENGLSHHPDEAVTTEDMGVAVEVLCNSILNIAADFRLPPR